MADTDDRPVAEPPRPAPAAGGGWPRGLWAAVPTPFRPDHALDLDGIAHNVRHLRDGLELAGIFINGLMGEGWSLTAAERREVLEATLAAAQSGLAVGVVTTHASLAETLELSRHADRAGADHIVLMRPAGLFAPAELGDFVRLIADAVECKVVLFDSEAQSGGYPAAIMRQLAEEGRIDAVKCTRHADAIVAVRAECGDVVPVCDPYEGHALANLMRFGQRILYADPEPYLYQTPQERPIEAYFEAHANGAERRMASQHARLEPLRRVYEHWIQTPLMRGQPINAALKLWCRRVGMMTGPVRPPLRELSTADAAALDAHLDAALGMVAATS